MDVWVDREQDGCHFPDERLKSRMGKLLKSLGDNDGIIRIRYLDIRRSLLAMNQFITKNTEFAELMARLESGSSDAVWELIDRYGSHVLRCVRRNMHYRLRSKFDSQDFVQMVWASFFRDPIQLKELTNPGQLVGLLASMARNKVISEVRRRLHSQNRCVTRETNLDAPAEGVELFAKDPTPSSIAIARERWHQLIDNQPPHVQTIIARRLAGTTFRDIASELGVHERTVRKTIEKLLKLSRKG